MSNRRASWLAIRQPLSPRKAAILKLASFLLPLGLWCVVSYVPFVWHNQIRITDPGDSELFVAKDRYARDVFESENARLIKGGYKPGSGDRVNPVFLPAPHEVAKAFYTAFKAEPFSKGDPWLHQSLWHSITIIFWGFVTSAIIGVPIGILCGTFDSFAKLFEPFIDFIRYMPAPVFGALCVVLLGIEDGPKIAVIWIGTFFQMVLVIANTTRQIDMALLEAAQTLGANPKRLLTHVIVPGILPNLYNDMRILLGFAWTYLIIAELIGASSGISWFINQQGKHFHFENVFAGIIMIGAIGLISDQLLALLRPKLFPWTASARASKKSTKLSFGWLRNLKSARPQREPVAPGTMRLVMDSEERRPADANVA